MLSHLNLAVWAENTVRILKKEKKLKKTSRPQIQHSKKLRQLFNEMEEFTTLKGIYFKLLTEGNSAVVLGEGRSDHHSDVVYLNKNTHTNKVLTFKLFKEKDS